MRELIISEIAQVAGGDMPSDLQHMVTNGFSNREMTAGVVGVAVGLLAGSALSYPIGPLAAMGSMAAWYFLSPAERVGTSALGETPILVEVTTQAPAIKKWKK